MVLWVYADSYGYFQPLCMAALSMMLEVPLCFWPFEARERPLRIFGQRGMLETLLS